MVVLLLTTIFGFALASYLKLVSNQNTAAMRSLSWNSAIPIAEAGVEEALTQINYGGTNLSANNNWQWKAGKYIWRERWLEGSRFLFRAGIYVEGTNTPVIAVEGFTRRPGSTNMVSRTVRVRTKPQYLFANAMVAQEKIELKGNDILVDSFDSSDPNYSTNGQYDSTKRKDNGTVATNSTNQNAFVSGNAKIWGKVATGPGAGISLGPNGSIGDSSWVSGGNKGIQSGHYSDDASVSLFDVPEPFSTASAPSSATVNGTNYDFVIGNGNWMLSGSTQFKGKVLVTGDATLYVTSAVQFSGGDFIQIQPGARLKLYVSCASATLGGQGIQNLTGNAASFIYYGLPSNTSISYSGNGTMLGAIYAPNAAFTMGGGGGGANQDFDLTGACITKSITMNGHFSCHFDEQLARSGPIKSFTVVAWDELGVTWDEILAQNLNLYSDSL